MSAEIDKMLSRFSIERLSPMQEEALKAIGEERGDVVILSPTGSGKTLAYMLPLIRLLNLEAPPMESAPYIQAIVVVPGRELAMQSADVMRGLGSGLRAACCYGGRPAMDEHRTIMKEKPHIVFGTPGRLNDHIAKGNIPAGNIRWLIIDEFDKCLEMGFRDEMRRLIKSLPGLKRRILLSATDAQDIPSFVNISRARRIDFTREKPQTTERLVINKVVSKDKDKLETLCRLLLHLGEESSIVFLNFRDSVERTAAFLRGRGFEVSAFHGGMEQREREDAIYKFGNGSANILVSTDLASRGLDIPDVGNIIHYHMPLGEDGYVHRVGRTARWDARGRTFFITGPGEAVPPFVEGDIAGWPLPDVKGKTPPRPRMSTIYIGKGKKDKISRGDIMGFLCKKGGLERGDIGRIDVMERYSYAAVARDKVEQMLRLTRGEKIKGIKTIAELVR